MVGIRDKRWMLTLWDFNVCMRFREKMHLYDYCIIGQEVCPLTRTLHFHAYIEFKKEYSLSSVKSILKVRDMHCEIARASRALCVNYCTKDNNVIFYHYVEENDDEEDKNIEYDEEIFDIFGIKVV